LLLLLQLPCLVRCARRAALLQLGQALLLLQALLLAQAVQDLRPRGPAPLALGGRLGGGGGLLLLLLLARRARRGGASPRRVVVLRVLLLLLLRILLLLLLVCLAQFALACSSSRHRRGIASVGASSTRRLG
jgi:hypothetical protein